MVFVKQRLDALRASLLTTWWHWRHPAVLGAFGFVALRFMQTEPEPGRGPYLHESMREYLRMADLPEELPDPVYPKRLSVLEKWTEGSVPRMSAQARDRKVFATMKEAVAFTSAHPNDGWIHSGGAGYAEGAMEASLAAWLARWES